MIVSWNWLKEYVLLDMPLDELTTRLMMAGLNHEGTSDVKGDFAIDLEVTSNRADCLGHLGVAREISVLWDRPLTIPPADPPHSATPVEQWTSVSLECPDLCYRYTARVIRGIRVGESPDWLHRRLATLGINSVNNVVDATNYVMMECGQPLHAFDMSRLAGGRIVVRDAAAKEPFLAINHRTYELSPGTCVIADAERAVGLGGVMGGADTEVSDRTTDVLIEAAWFEPVAIRRTARALNLRSDSSYRFERGVDPERIDWASRRCCQLILQLAGGELAAGLIDVGRRPDPPIPIVLRFDQIQRLLGIRFDRQRVRQILTALGLEETGGTATQIELIPPSWRHDLTREIDLIEEVGRTHGYEAVPEDVPVPMTISSKSKRERVLEHLRRVMTAAGFDEAMTISAVDERLSNTFSPWTTAPPLRAATPVLRRADLLRRSLVPSLLAACRENEKLANQRVELFEIAHVYLSRDGQLPEELSMLGLVSGAGYFRVKAVVEALLAELNPAARLVWSPTAEPLLDENRSSQVSCEGRILGFVGEVHPSGRKPFELQRAATVAELHVGELIEIAQLVAKYVKQSPYPSVERDLNLEVTEDVPWAAVADAVRLSAGATLESLDYKETYRDTALLSTGQKSLHFGITLRSGEGTLASAQADEVRDRIVAKCQAAFGAQLRT